MPRSHLRTVAAALLALAAVAPTLSGADWPQWRGPNRDDVSTETGLLKSWPEGGPRRVWLFEDCGVGYSGPAIVGNRLYIMGARDGNDLLLAIDATTGEELWFAHVGEMVENNWGDGARGTPSVDGDHVYGMGSQGNLVCVSAAQGELVWTKSMEELGGNRPNWAFTESPLVYKDLVLCTPGGEQGAIAALNKNTGEVVWQSADVTSEAHYSSIVLAQRAQGDEFVQLLPDQLVGVDAKDGKLLWSQPWPGRVAVIPTPIVKDDLVYVTSGYGIGCMLVGVGPDHAVELVYENKEMKNQHGGVILVGDHVYGHSDDVGWVCQDLKTGERVWRDRESLGKGAVAYADGMLYCISEDEGEVALVEASPEGWNEHGRFKLDPQTEVRKPAGKIWTHPVICDGKLYLRDQNLLFCFDIKAAGSTAAGQ